MPLSAIAGHKIKIRARNFGVSFRLTVRYAVYRIIQIGSRDRGRATGCLSRGMVG
jgi:hypothetical protein